MNDVKKHYSDCPILDRIINHLKEKEKKDLILVVIVVAVFYGAGAFAAISGGQSFSLYELLCAPLVPSIIIGASVYSYVNYMKPINKIKQTLSLGSDEELEAILKESTVFDNRVSVSDNYIMDFKSGLAVKTNHIKGIVRCDSFSKYVSCYIKLLLTNEPPKLLDFSNSSLCDDVANHIEKVIKISQDNIEQF